MDPDIATAARALAVGDALGALKKVALRDDPSALALRGIAMAQLEDYRGARQLLRRAARGFGARQSVARARCMVAEAEVTLAMRDLKGLTHTLAAATATLQASADHANALHARLISVRCLLLLGRLTEAKAELARLERRNLPPALAAVCELANAELALRAWRIDGAQAALARAAAAASAAQIPALRAEVLQALTSLQLPAARRLYADSVQELRMDEVAALRTSGCLLVDGCRHAVLCTDTCVSLARRPVLFALLHGLARAWPQDVDRNALIAAAFRMRVADETHRARLRVEIGRLRALLGPLAQIEATERGFVLKPDANRNVVVLTPPAGGAQGSIIALLSDGAAWSTSALALAMGTKQRTVQRALVALQAAGQVRSTGRGRAQRWLAPSLVGFATILLLPDVPARQ